MSGKYTKMTTSWFLPAKTRARSVRLSGYCAAKKQVIVEKANMVKKHTKPNPYANQPGGIIEKEMPLDLSNVQLVCNACSKPTRVGYKFTDDNKKVRYCKKCNETIS